MRVDFKLQGFEEAKKEFANKSFRIQKLAAMAINKAAEHGKAVIAKAVKKDFTMKARDIKEEIKITQKANMRWLQAEITIGDKTIPLIQFQHKGTGLRRGQRVKGLSKTKRPNVRFNTVQVQVKRSGGYKPMKQAFIANGRYGQDIFIRKGKSRIPIKGLRGPSIAGMVKDVNIMQKSKDAINWKMNDEFRRGLTHALGKGRLAGE